MFNNSRTFSIFLLLLTLTFLPGCDDSAQESHNFSKPRFIILENAPAHFNGTESDLLTGGLGLEGLRSSIPPLVPLNLRTLSIYTNFRGIVDLTERGGFGRLYGSTDGADIKIPGTEYMALGRISGQSYPYAIAIQIPDSFDTKHPCLIVGPSSGSRGVYGAIGTAGLWGLTHGCAVALTDKTTGTGAAFLKTGEAYGLTLNLLPKTSAEPTLFRPEESNALQTFRLRHPNRVAFKHAHSQENVEKDWGKATLQAAEYGLYILNRHFRNSDGFSSENVTVIAASISNGAASVIHAGEEDQAGLIDGIVASEPNITPINLHGAKIMVDGQMIAQAGRPLYDYATLMALYAPCAVLAPAVAGNIWAQKTQANRDEYISWCTALSAQGLLTGNSVNSLADEAGQTIRQAGFDKESDLFIHVGVAINLWPSIAITYANAYGRFSAQDDICGVSFAYTDKAGKPRPASKIEKEILAALSNGTPPIANAVNLIYESAGPLSKFNSVLCLRKLFTGQNAFAQRVRDGVKEVQVQADLHNTPTIILHGRSDALISVNHASRAYVAAQAIQHPGAGNLHYYEIKNGQHFDSLLPLPAFAAHYVPMHYYFDQSLDLMMNYLTRDGTLPPSQVIKTRPRQADAPILPPLAQDNLGNIAHNPGDNHILFREGILIIP